MADRVLAEMAAWGAASDLAARNRLVNARIAAVGPDLFTMVEHCPQWRKTPLPTPAATAGRQYVAVAGKGTATVVYDARVFEHVPDLVPGLPTAVRSDAQAGRVGPGGGAASADSPKSSCLCVLRRRADGLAFLVLAVHFESGTPAVTAKVRLRSRQLCACLAELDHAVRAIRLAGLRAAVLLCGDLNAVREEFVHGNTEAFFESRRIAGATRAHKRPAGGAAHRFAAAPGTAELGGAPSFELRLAVRGVDGGWLQEVSHTENGSGCTRAGSPVVIDYILGGTVGMAGTVGVGGAGAEGAGAGPMSYMAHPVVTKAEVAAAADVSDGVRSAVIAVGSDHLPVAADVSFDTVLL